MLRSSVAALRSRSRSSFSANAFSRGVGGSESTLKEQHASSPALLLLSMPTRSFSSSSSSSVAPGTPGTTRGKSDQLFDHPPRGDNFDFDPLRPKLSASAAEQLKNRRRRAPQAFDMPSKEYTAKVTANREKYKKLFWYLSAGWGVALVFAGYQSWDYMINGDTKAATPYFNKMSHKEIELHIQAEKNAAKERAKTTWGRRPGDVPQEVLDAIDNPATDKYYDPRLTRGRYRKE